MVLCLLHYQFINMTGNSTTLLLDTLLQVTLPQEFIPHDSVPHEFALFLPVVTYVN